MLTHYERMMNRVTHRARVKSLIQKIADDGRNPIWKTLPLMVGQAVTSDGIEVPPMSMDPTVITAAHIEIQKWVLDHQDDPYSYSECSTKKDYLNLGGYLSELCGKENAITMLMVNHQWICHERAGKRVYEVSPGLAEQLRYTEVRGITAEDLRLPYESIYIQIPPASGLKIWNNVTGWHTAVGAYITEENSMTEDDIYHKTGEVGAYRGWRILLVGEDLAADDNLGDDALSFFRILLKDGTKLTDILKLCREEMEESTQSMESTWTEQMSLDWENQFRWCMNVVLYATWQEPGEHWISNKEARQLWGRIQKSPPKSSKRKALSKRYQQLDPQRRILLGKSIIIDRTRPTPDKEKSGNRISGKSRNLMRIKTRVSGHWKHVLYGEKRSQRRYQWIEPYWRNKDCEEKDQQTKHELR